MGQAPHHPGIAIVPAFIVTFIYGEKGIASLLLLSQVILSMQLSFAVIPLIMFTKRSRQDGHLCKPYSHKSDCLDHCGDHTFPECLPALQDLCLALPNFSSY